MFRNLDYLRHWMQHYFSYCLGMLPSDGTLAPCGLYQVFKVG